MQDTDIKNPYGDFCRELQAADCEAYKRFAQRVALECRVTRAALYNWRHGITDIKALNRETINQIAMEMTGRPVFTTEEGGAQ